MAIILVISVMLNFFLIYKLFDSQVSIDHSRMENQSLQRTSEASLILIQKLAEKVTPEDFAGIIEDANRSNLVVQNKGSKILVNEYEFQIIDNKVSVKKF